MSHCAFCSTRKGRRPCPALGGICSRCCGEHRVRDIACPPDCAFLKPAPAGRPDALARAMQRLDDWILAEGPQWQRRTAGAFFGSEVQAPDGRPTVEGWELDGFLAWLACGYEEPGAGRAVDQFAAAHEGELAEDEQQAWEEIRRAWPSLLRVRAVRPGVGVQVRDLVTGEASFVHERLGSRQLEPGQVLLVWLVPRRGRIEILRGACCVPPEHAGTVLRALKAEVGRQNGQETAAPREVLLRRAMPVAHRAVREAMRASLAQTLRDPAAERVYAVRDPSAVRARLSAWRDVEQVGDGRYRLRLRRGRHPGEAAVELRLETVRLTVKASGREHLDAAGLAVSRRLGSAVQHRGDRIAEAEGPGLVMGEAAPDGDIHTFHRRLDVSMLRWIEEQAPRAARVERRESLQPSGDDVHRLPLLGHESMYRCVPGMREAVERTARRLRAGWGKRGRPPALGQDALRGMPEVQELLLGNARDGRARGWPERDLLTEANLLGEHVYYALCHHLWNRKTFWLEESLAWMLSKTDLDIRGNCLELPFGAFALVFTDRGTLDLAEQLLTHVPDSRLRGAPLQILTVYVVRLPDPGDGARGIHVCFLFEGGDGGWPYLITRELHVRDDADLQEILESRHPEIDVGSLDPVFVAPELESLLHIVVNAVLYATSAHLEPIVLAPEAGGGRRGRGRRRRDRRGAGTWSGETVFYVPGKIDISRVRRLRELAETEGGRRLTSRFLVRGHWRRAAAGWRDQRLRWIEPHWRGPDLAAVIERDFRLRP